MKTSQYKSLGFTLDISVPDSIEEFDRLAGRAGAALEFAVSHEVAHGTLGDFRTKFCETLEKETGVARPFHTVPAKKDGGKPTEVWGTADSKVRTEDEFFKMVLASTGKKAEDFTSLAASVISSITFDPKTKERTSTGPTLAKMYIQAAENILTNPKGGPDVARAVVLKLTGVEVPADATTEQLKTRLASAIRDDQQKKDLAGAYMKKV